jgi:SPP1 gp7 family putative phage head morphogenesis protein
MTYKRWRIPLRTSKIYSGALLKIFRPLLRALRGAMTLEAQQKIIDDFINSDTFATAAEKAVRVMIASVHKATARDWRAAAKKGAQGARINRALKRELDGPVGKRVQELIHDNVKYIKTVPRSVATDFIEKATRNAQEGTLRASDLAKKLREEYPHATDTVIKRIARTETSKASAALTRARAESLDLFFYVWRTSEDRRVRTSHHAMQGMICDYKHPPSPELIANKKGMLQDRVRGAGKPWKYVGDYHAGEIYNCRCYAEVLMDLDQVKWPCEVCTGGGAFGKMHKHVFIKMARWPKDV